MLDWYKRLWFVKGLALGVCTAPCGSTAAGPRDFITDWAAQHAARHRPHGMVLTEYGARTGI